MSPPGQFINSEFPLAALQVRPVKKGLRMLNTTCAMPARRPSAGEILDTPLPDLLSDLAVKLFDSSIDDRTFFGAVVQRKDGQLLLSMPAGRTELEHDTVARYLLAQAFDVDLPDLPPPFVTTSAI